MVVWSYDRLIVSYAYDRMDICSYDHMIIRSCGRIAIYDHMSIWSHDRPIKWSYEDIVIWAHDRTIIPPAQKFWFRCGPTSGQIRAISDWIRHFDAVDMFNKMKKQVCYKAPSSPVCPSCTRHDNQSRIQSFFLCFSQGCMIMWPHDHDMTIWSYEPVIICSYEHMDLWYDHMLIWLNDHTVKWPHDHMIRRSHDHMIIWSYRHMITRSRGHIIIPSNDQMITWSSEHMII